MYIYIYIPLGDIPPIETIHSWDRSKPPRGQTLRSPRPKVTSVRDKDVYTTTNKCSQCLLKIIYAAF